MRRLPIIDQSRPRAGGLCAGPARAGHLVVAVPD